MAPGPTLAVAISETLQHGFAAGLRVAVAPLLTDAPIITLCGLLLMGLRQLDGFFGAVSFLGAFFLFYLAYQSLTLGPIAATTIPANPRSLRKGVITNLLNPGPYLFWMTVGTPTLFQAYERGLGHALVFMSAFFVCLVGSKAGVALAVSRFRGFLSGRPYRIIIKTLGLILAVFAILFLRKGLIYFGAL